LIFKTFQNDQRERLITKYSNGQKNLTLRLMEIVL